MACSGSEKDEGNSSTAVSIFCVSDVHTGNVLRPPAAKFSIGAQGWLRVLQPNKHISAARADAARSDAARPCRGPAFGSGIRMYVRIGALAP